MNLFETLFSFCVNKCLYSALPMGLGWCYDICLQNISKDVYLVAMWSEINASTLRKQKREICTSFMLPSVYICVSVIGTYAIIGKWHSTIIFQCIWHCSRHMLTDYTKVLRQLFIYCSNDTISLFNLMQHCSDMLSALMKIASLWHAEFLNW